MNERPVTGFALFDTPIGCCAIAWSDAGVTSLQLPQGGQSAMRRRMAHRFGATADVAAPAAVADAVAQVQRLLAGEALSLDGVGLDMTGVPDFHQRVYAAARRIACGTTLTYGELAVRMGEPGAARSVGQALGANPFAIIVPCHRVLGANGQPGGFSAPGGVNTKMRLLEIEGARRGDEPDLFA